MKKEIVGSWSWKPREELPANEVKDKGFPTPSLEAAKFTSDGRYVFVQAVPGYDTDVAGQRVPVPEEWHEWKGTWEIDKGELTMSESSPEDRWLAKHRDQGWVSESEPTAWGRSFRIVELKSHQLRLKAIALGDFDRTFHRVNTMPERPPLAAAP